ncbi:hypothetical protein Syn7803US13_193 [Synechococcus phage ACG-2014f]|jgi:hypothetical protein|uniref:Uncharacterized protein n=3 Tax=Atlauavirus TaxID=2733092 RepID=A0A0E3G3H9_9CAUD|nr:hypothetical protein HOQ61_gp201 [Synechococcus phage ACG-2014f_Syn7803C7]YP_009778643.1 hypothetical protein HOQ62_gp203 [Synechococcus phage ACG-2014f_Syn7803C8]AIX18501.1 hypothetical protein Syn7803C6_202 [Synechococcus phage ACG-2014f]AIX20092.1 hypothetical protein Syn7803C7_201 [Synechococcus phage ACG-2014f_Syn7803C7]AIX20379.1 hypothetical protein Syn7803C80_202 [Synechococcus phage ACG-2014f]AIX21527.1 hypothetical protein Syn7803C8_203 [Synechococcus phage ACG-2014f_Syn7803C8]AI
MSSEPFLEWMVKPPISDEELMLICLKNAPCGTNRKQAMKLIRVLEVKLAEPTGFANIFPQPKPGGESDYAG